MRALAVVAVVVVLVAGVWTWRSRPHAEPVRPVSTAAAPGGGTAVPGRPVRVEREVVVAVAGKVRRPGLVRLPAGSRVGDAVAAAGGAASTPSTLAGATAGTASRFAGTTTRLTVPDRPAITGPQASWAAAGTASASANPTGTPGRRRRPASRGRAARRPPGRCPGRAGVTGALLLAALSVALLLAARRPSVRRLVAVCAVAAVLGALPVRLLAAGWPPPGWVVVACAVGQGDAVVLPVAAGRAVVIDAGPDPAGVDGCLRRLGVREVPLLVVSHFHADHVGGIAGVFRGRRVADVVTPQWSEPPYGVSQVRAAARDGGAVLRAVSAGWRWRAGAAELAVLGPPYPLRGSRSDPNNNSLVLAATVAGVRILLAGDAETEEQRALLETLPPGAVRADVLKVAHHGSAYQDPEFLAAVRPAVALVCVGADNEYGHPSPGLLDRLTRAGARVLRTDTDGDVAAVRDGPGLAVVARGVGPGRRGGR